MINGTYPSKEFNSNIYISIKKCLGNNCASPIEINDFIDNLMIRRIGIQNFVNFNQRDGQPTSINIIPILIPLFSDKILTRVTKLQ